ncbi:MAG: uncharacterized protein QOE77_3191 [Blastocatellia bacterium]|jgi:uncharacterized protein (DUF1684 family)|nr:uncharacterized protein [Blastocatellia bacterium]
MPKSAFPSSSFRVLLFILLLASAFLPACRKSAAPVFDAAAHRQEIQKWQATRLERLTEPDGWLSLVGLFWLHEGENKFGSDPKNPVVLPEGKAPAVTGSFWLKDGRVQLTTRARIPISLSTPSTGDIEVLGRLIAVPIERSRNLYLTDDTQDNGPTRLEIDSLIINVVKRGDRIGIRVKDPKSLTRQEFKGLEYFPIDPKWRIEARFEPYQPPKIIQIDNVLNMTDDETSPGALAFEVNGKTYRIDPILEQGETDYFVMIADETTGGETYGAGRYLYVSPPDASGKVIIDFNKAYSPPCAFTGFATCPLPPQQNHLPLRIEAGEKKYAGPVH